MSAECGWCKQEFEPRRNGMNAGRYCSDTCRMIVRRLAGFTNLGGGAGAAEEFSPKNWDGHTRYNDEPQRYVYRVVCSLCARDRWMRWSKQEVPRIIPRCAVCGGWCAVEADLGMTKAQT